MSNIIGLCGAAGSGKSLVAEELEGMGYKRIRFADPLKNMTRAFYRSCGLEEDEIERRIEGDLKEVPDPLMGGKTPRYAMQTLGTEWGRNLISENILAETWLRRAEKEILAGNKIVAEDVRFATEDTAIHQLGGLIVQISGRKKENVSKTHASEKFIGVNPDLRYSNTGTIEDLKFWVNMVFRDDHESEVAA